jgi:hypothetical protein
MTLPYRTAEQTVMYKVVMAHKAACSGEALCCSWPGNRNNKFHERLSIKWNQEQHIAPNGAKKPNDNI